MSDVERIDWAAKAKAMSRDTMIPDDVREALWMVAMESDDLRRELRFLIGSIGSIIENAIVRAEDLGVPTNR